MILMNIMPAIFETPPCHATLQLCRSFLMLTTLLSSQFKEKLPTLALMKDMFPMTRIMKLI
eukprot:11643560-Karenia_brevis.AAC.1